MSKRNYNVFFNTHTVSGIVISVALYVIFFTGAFSLFKEEIELWEAPKTEKRSSKANINVDSVLNHLDEKYSLKGRDIQLNLDVKGNTIYSFLGEVKDSTVAKKEVHGEFLYINTETLEKRTYEENYSLGEFLYRLHFFAQIPYVGVYLAGFVALFFLFAIVTGVIVHWKKIIPNFYHFNPKIALKRVWTDAHTALGIIGLPYQFIFAVSGAYFALSILVLLPANFLYGGDQGKLIGDMRPERKVVKWIGEKDHHQNAIGFNTALNQVSSEWKNFHISQCFIKNYGGKNMQYVITGELEDQDRFVGIGRMVIDSYSGDILDKKIPNELDYLVDSQFVMSRLHFASYGGTPLKIIYFVLALITCFVIITGVLIWIEARNKKSKTLKQRLYTTKVGHIYLAICLTLFPVTALFFIIVKILPEVYETQKMSILYTWFFGVWLILTLYYRFKRNNYFTNKTTLLIGGILGFIVPVVSGLVSNNWIWKTYANKQFEIFTIDVLWLFLSITALLIYFKIKPSIKEQSSYSKNPINYKNLKTLLKQEENRTTINQNLPIKKNKNFITMRTKVISLWTLLVIGFILHHVYGIANVYFQESLVLEGSKGEIPSWAHQWRIILEGMAFLFAVLTVSLSQNWFKWTSLIWAFLLGLFNVYHFITALIYEPSNISEILILLLMAIANVFLVQELLVWKSHVSSHE
ncbi:hypothetical protein BTO06_07190 [Tenacibaculum sp. SZ-18]|uniref:PepSY-associated TM helix domain-containing protein n=1 Tax=Tenacibaculum sp. SZ-18 TaxID=754423 RepID=UPI000C2D1DD3|nr:PepSY-associated TM helix domain-containing protein [Tenacibaculum sp. SZ-18]AUC14935.1 hypothetical protein BTO06_07190 [Tenacibaculum sp. SZ-18]